MELRSVLEALLFVSQKALSARELKDVLRQTADAEDAPEEARVWRKTSEAEIEVELTALAKHYDQAGRSYQLVCVAGAWQFVSRPEFAPWVRALVGVKARPPRLSQAALETLAIIAYRQPVTRAEVEQIRGVNVDGVMQTLLERGLIQESGRAETVGRPMTYGTTEQFLHYFGLRSLDDLPAADELRRWTAPPSAAATPELGLATPPPAPLTTTTGNGSAPTNTEHNPSLTSPPVEVPPAPPGQPDQPPSTPTAHGPT